MDFHQRMCLRPVLWAKLHELTGNAFQEFFQETMALVDPSFVDVRTHGKLGDMASDGLTLRDGKLYACYAPETPDAAKTIAKFNSDLASALKKRKTEFSEFVFVHNDTRGIHPQISKELSAAAQSNSEITFTTLGIRHFQDMLGRLELDQVEQLLRMQLPIGHEISLGLAEMEDLLKHLSKERIPSDPTMVMAQVSARKLEYNEFSLDTQSEIRDGMRFSAMINRYYQERIDVVERDEVAARFQTEYAFAADEFDDPEDILLRLRVFLAGTTATRADAYRAQTAVLAYFFQTCDIFRDAPSDAIAVDPQIQKT